MLDQLQMPHNNSFFFGRTIRNRKHSVCYTLHIWTLFRYIWTNVTCIKWNSSSQWVEGSIIFCLRYTSSNFGRLQITQLRYIVGFLCVSTTIKRYYPFTKLAKIQLNPCHTVAVEHLLKKEKWDIPSYILRPAVFAILTSFVEMILRSRV